MPKDTRTDEMAPGSRTEQRGLCSLRTCQDDGTHIDAPLIFIRSSHLPSIEADRGGVMLPKCHGLPTSFEPDAGSGFQEETRTETVPHFMQKWGSPVSPYVFDVICRGSVQVAPLRGRGAYLIVMSDDGEHSCSVYLSWRCRARDSKIPREQRSGSAGF